MIIAAVVAAAIVLAALGPLLLRRARARGSSEPQSKHGAANRWLDPEELLFSIPTLNDRLPPIDSRATFVSESQAALMHEDDWRQEEFTPVENREFVLNVFSQLATHRAIHASGIGFREVFVRGETPFPLAMRKLTVDEIRRVLQVPIVPLYLNASAASRVLGGFAVPMPDVGFAYGHETNGIVTALGLGLVGTGLGDVERLAELADRHQLLFVDWIRNILIEPGDARGLRHWLDAIIHQDPDRPPNDH